MPTQTSSVNVAIIMVDKLRTVEPNSELIQALQANGFREVHYLLFEDDALELQKQQLS